MMLPNVCRVCLGNDAEISLFDTADDLNNYGAKIMECVHIRISETDGYPNKICEKCCLELAIAYSFISKCKTSDDHLRSQLIHLGSTGTENDVKDFDTIKLESNQMEGNSYLHDPSNDDKIAVYKEEILEDEVNYLNEKQKIKTRNVESFEFFHFSDSDRDIDSVLSSVLLDNSKRRKRNKKHKLKRKTSKSKKKKYTSKDFIPKAEQCTMCGLRVASSSALQIHMRTHTGEKPFKCAFCDKAFALKSTLQEHELRLHSTTDKNITCESCGKQFHKGRDLVVHMRVHTKETPYLCPHCPKRFTQHASIIKHIRMHTGERPFSCKVCGKSFASQSHVKSHATSHSELRPYKCATCGKAVKNKNSLMQHIKRHVGNKDFICDQCGSTFSTKGNLVVHVMTIHSELSGVCHICNKPSSNLENHLKIHTGELLFECQYCQKKFRKCNLSSHLIKHTNSGKYKCEAEKCTKSFSNKHLLDFHILKHHLKTPQYMCNHCLKSFYRPCDLATHDRRTHGNKTTNG